MYTSSVFNRFAETGAALQKRALELQFAPETVKSLRRFSTPEVAGFLGISDSHLRNICRDPRNDIPEGLQIGQKKTFSLDEVNAIREHLHSTTGRRQYSPRRRKGEPPLRVVFENQKGGVGKTTHAILLAQYMAQRGYRVLLVDLDPQGSATSLFGVMPTSDALGDDHTFAAYIRDEQAGMRRLVRPTYWPGIDLVPASIDLQMVEFEITAAILRSKSAKTFYPFFSRLDQAIAEVEGDYDVVICDSKPDIGWLVINALFACNVLVIPMTCSMLDFASATELFRAMARITGDIEQYTGAALKFDQIRFLATRFEVNDISQDQLFHAMIQMFPTFVLREPMIRSVAIDAAGNNKLSLYEYEADSNTRRSYQRAIERADTVNRLLLEDLLRLWGREVETDMEAA